MLGSTELILDMSHKGNNNHTQSLVEKTAILVDRGDPSINLKRSTLTIPNHCKLLLSSLNYYNLQAL